MTREFILDTLLEYKLDPGKCAVYAAGCVYLDPSTGNKCAVGKHLIDGEHQKFLGNVVELFEIYSTDILTDNAKLQNISIPIWIEMQIYHDIIATNCSTEIINEILIRLENLTGFEFPELRF